MHDPTLPTAVPPARGAPAPTVVVVVQPTASSAVPVAALRDAARAADALALVPPTIADPEAWADAAVRSWWPGAVVATAVPVTDAMKEVDPDGIVVTSVDRATLRWGRAPAVLPVVELVGALAAFEDGDSVDPVALLAGRGVAVHVFGGPPVT